MRLSAEDMRALDNYTAITKAIAEKDATISRITADNEALRKRNERLRWALDDMLFEYGDRYDNECRLKDASELDMIAKARAARAKEEAGG